MDIPIDAELYHILKRLDALGFPSIVVGGYVRDALLGISSKDADIEVYRATCEQLADALGEFGRVDLVGKSFGVVKLRVGDVQYDFAIPRTESKIGVGHREFLSMFNPEMKPREAAARRDLTVNAIGWDPVRKELHDYYGGVRDLRDGVLRATSDAFAEDPLRVLRVVQFAARFDMSVEPRTANMCRNLAAEYETLPHERIAEEWMKLAIKGRRFQRMFDALLATGWIEFYPEIQGIVNVPQDPEWHPEGPVHVHTAHAMDAAAAIADRDRMQGDDRATLVFATMAHDLGKAATTRSADVRGQRRIVSRGHDDAGTDLAVSLLQRMGIKIDIIRRVEKLVANHMAHISMAGHPTVKALRRCGCSRRA
jgi:tRNA nucleotidyltransferase (CCA-adding enzyme)